MSSRVLQPHDLFALERSQWADIHRHHYAYNGNETFNFSASDLMPNQLPLLNDSEADFLNGFLDSSANAFTDPGFFDAEIQRNLPGNFGWVLEEPAPTLQQVSGTATSPVQTFRPHHVSPQPTYSSAPSNNAPLTAEQIFNTVPLIPHQGPQHHHVPPPPQMSISQAQATHAVPSAVSSTYLPSAPQPTASPPTIRQRRQSTANSPQLVFGLKPFSETTGEILTPNAGANFDENAHAGIPPQSQEQRSQRSASTHSRHFSESFLMPSTRSRHGSESAIIEPNPRLYRFGSDAHFGVDGYVRERHEPSAEQVQQAILDNNFGAIGGGFLSASSTRAPSPAGDRRRVKQEPASDDSDEPQRKRRRNTVAQLPRPQTAAAAASSSLAFRRRRASPQTGTSSTPARRQPRENLTEQQKRDNHIASEQKRRNFIKDGFEKLSKIVPGLTTQQLSKSNVLVEGTAYLERLVAGNEDLKAKLGL